MCYACLYTINNTEPTFRKFYITISCNESECFPLNLHVQCISHDYGGFFLQAYIYIYNIFLFSLLLQKPDLNKYAFLPLSLPPKNTNKTKPQCSIDLVLFRLNCALMMMLFYWIGAPPSLWSRKYVQLLHLYCLRSKIVYKFVLIEMNCFSREGVWNNKSKLFCYYYCNDSSTKHRGIIDLHQHQHLSKSFSLSAWYGWYPFWCWFSWP